MRKQWIYRGFFYIISMLVLAFGITLNTKSGLGVSPIISVSYCVSEILHASFGNMTLILYSVFVVVELIIHFLTHQYKYLILDMLQFPISLIVTRFMNLFVWFLPDFTSDYAGSFWGSLAGRILVLIVAIIFTGIGAAVSLNMRVVPNPGDGIVQALADVARKNVGLMKNMFDISCVGTTIFMCMFWKGEILGIGIGTILAMLGVGRVIAVFNYFFKERMNELAGVEY